MQNSIEKVFVSYSWDSKEHQLWVLDLVRKLRQEGYDANFDKGITATSTVNLNQMMVEHMRDDDYIVLVLTEQYTAKAEGFKGGVGFETILSLPIIQQNLDKLIILIRQPSVIRKGIPFHLQGINYIDFSDPIDFEEKFEELIYRLQKIPMFDLGPIGKKKIRQSKMQENNATEFIVNEIRIPKLNPPTDLNKNTFIEENFHLIVRGIDEILNTIQSQNPFFYYQKDNVNSGKVVYAFYLNGQNSNNLKLWLGSFLSPIKQIQFSLGRYIDVNNDNSMNGSVSIEVDTDNNLSLAMPMSVFLSDKKNMNYSEVVKEIYEHYILPHLT